MEENLQTRIKLRKDILESSLRDAEQCIKSAGEDGVLLETMLQSQMALKSAVDSMEKLIDIYTEKGMQTSILETCLQLQIKAEEIIRTLDCFLRTEPNNNADKTCNIKLPKLELPKFKGTVTHWTSFWDRFSTSIHKSSTLQDSEKLAYLIGCLEGEALQAVEGLSTNSANYQIAVEMLNQRFGKKESLVSAHYSELFALPCAGEETGECRTTLDTIEKHLRVLQSLGEDTYLNHIRVLILSKFPKKIVYELKLRCQTEDVATIRSELEKIVSAMEGTAPTLKFRTAENTRESTPAEYSSTTGALHIQARPSFRGGRGGRGRNARGGGRGANNNHGNNGSTNEGNNSRKRPNQSHNREAKGKKPKMSCIFCGAAHYNDTCAKFSSVEERRRLIKEAGRCFACFSKQHCFKDCNKKKECRHCQQTTHNRALCPKRYPNHLGKSPEFSESLREEKSFCFSNYLSYLQTATVKVSNRNKTENCRLLLDSGSQRSYMTQRLAGKLKLNTKGEDRLMIYTFGSDTPKETLSPSAIINILTKRGVEKELKVNIVPHITDRIAIQKATSFKVDIMADDDSIGEEIDLLIGNDYYFSFMKNEAVKVKENLYIVNTDFGWIISGKQTETDVKENTLSIITYCHCYDPECKYFTEPDLPLKDVDLKFLWSLESIGITDSPKTTREEEAVKHFNDTVKYDGHRYQVKWPWTMYPPDIPTNYGLAYGRLKGLLNRSNQDLLQEYSSVIKEQLDSGTIEIVEPQSDVTNQTVPPIHYLPHHIVKQEGKKGRIVYDASARLKDQKSLNECMYRGPSLISDLTALLVQFRSNQVAITADVEKAFLQIELQQEDRDVTRFLWVHDYNKPLSEENIVHMRFTRVPFGIISSPFLLTATLRYHLSTKNPQLLTKIADKCYVDNLVTGAESCKEAYKMYLEARRVFQELAMNIREWNSNGQELMDKIPQEHRAKSMEEKVLGLLWDVKEDTLYLKVKPHIFEGVDDALSKRDILSKIASLYDPCGLVSPLILPAKLLLQETWSRKLTWNTKLPDDLQQRWKEVVENLKAVSEVRVPRFVSLASVNGRIVHELHCFTDASKNAYAAVVYLRACNGDQIKVSHVMSKSRVTPMDEKKNLQIPRLELLGFYIGNKLITYVKDALGLTIENQYLWTDSLIVLSWMKSNKLLDPFVARRVNDIKKNRGLELCYINTDTNPADVATRPELWSEKNNLWFHGPSFLSEDKSTWPESMNLSYHHAILVSGEGLDRIYPEGQMPQEPMEVNVGEPNETQTQDETLKEIKRLQRENFSAEVMGKKTQLSKNLGLYLDVDGVLRCTGRMANADWSYEKKHPAIIPKDCDFTNKVIQDIHERNYHVGVSHTLSLIRQNFWIPQGRAQVQKVLKRCPRCVKHGGGPFKLPPTPALPAERVTYKAPFTFTGIDYFGPLYVETETGKEKRWVCLLTCLAVRAIHLEIVKDLTAEECLLALRRFFASRGVPEMIVSDNATQFKLTSELLNSPYCVERKVKWRFIPALAPWNGAFYERMIGLVKHCMKRTLEKHLLRDSQLLTIVKEIEAVVNTRPLTCVGTEVEHVLKPADFLTLGECLSVEPSTSSQEDSELGTFTKRSLIDSWKRGMRIIGEFKKMLSDQYLTSLRERYNHSPKQPRVTCRRVPRVGEIVQIKEDTKNRENWKVGKITSLHRGPDGECRVAKVKVGNSEFTRSISHLYPLEIEEATSRPTSVSENIGSQTARQSPDRERDGIVELEADNVVDGMRRISIDNIEAVRDLDNESLSESDLVEERPTQEQDEIDRAQGVQGGEPEEDESERTDSMRPQRAAAIRAREKIAELTRHLLALL